MFDDGEGCMWIFGMVLLTVVLIIGSYALAVVKCDQIGEESAVDTKYRFISGCYVKIDEKWVPEERWRNFGE